MREKILLTLFVATLTLNAFSQSKAIIGGEIKNNTIDSISIIIDNGIRGTSQKHYKSNIDSKGRFKIVIPLTESKKALLNTGKENIPLFITPKDSIWCTFNGSNVYQSIDFKGKNSNHYKYFTEYYNTFSMPHGSFFKPRYEDVFNLKPAEFKKYRKEKVNKDLLFLENYSKNHSMSEEFKRYAEVEIKYSYYYGLLSYRSFKKYFKKVDEKLPEDFYADISNKLFDHNAFLNSDNYINATNMYIQELNMEEYKNPQSYFPKALSVSSKILSGKTLFNYQVNLLSQMLNTDASAKLKDSLISNFLNKCPYDDYNIAITNAYVKNIKLNNQSFSQNTLKSIFETKEDKEISFEKVLKKHKGKVIYMDVWASWCGPCKVEMPYSKNLKDKFKNDKVVFMYLSVDSKKELWKNAIDNWEIKGEHYLIKDGFKSEFASYFNIYGIPHYILIDKRGKVIFPSAVRPSLKSIEPYIRTLLSK